MTRIFKKFRIPYVERVQIMKDMEEINLNLWQSMFFLRGYRYAHDHPSMQFVKECIERVRLIAKRDSRDENWRAELMQAYMAGRGDNITTDAFNDFERWYLLNYHS